MATTEAVFEVFSPFLNFMVFGLLVFSYRSVTHSVKPTGQSTRLPSVPVQALRVSALWLYVLDCTMILKQACAVQKESGIVGPLGRASYELCA